MLLNKSVARLKKKNTIHDNIIVRPTKLVIFSRVAIYLIYSLRLTCDIARFSVRARNARLTLPRGRGFLVLRARLERLPVQHTFLPYLTKHVGGL